MILTKSPDLKRIEKQEGIPTFEQSLWSTHNPTWKAEHRLTQFNYQQE
jgi:hypothetical protein